MPLQDYRIASGYNVALGSLTNIETITVSNLKFVVLRSYGSLSPGVRRIRGDGTDYFAGYRTVQWLFGGMTFAQYEYLSTTYCAGAYSGKVTIYTKLASNTAYSRCNAILTLPEPKDVDRRVNGYAGVILAFRQVVPL